MQQERRNARLRHRGCLYRRGRWHLFCGFLDITHRRAHTRTLVGAEGNDGLAAEIEAFKERIHHHRHRAPPVGIAKDDGIVSVDAVNLVFQLRPSLLAQLGLGPVDTFVIIFRILVGRVNMVNIGIGQQGFQLFNNHFGITLLEVANRTVPIVFSATGVVGY